MTSKLIEALNKCETRKSYENVRYTLIDDELRAYIEKSLERLETLENKYAAALIKVRAWEIQGEKLKNENQILKMSVKDTYDTGQEIISELQQEKEKLKKAIEILKRFKNEYEEHGQGYYHLLEYTKSYYELVIDSSIELTQQEYELLKEVLG